MHIAWASALSLFYKDRQCEGRRTWNRATGTAPRFYFYIPVRIGSRRTKQQHCIAVVEYGDISRFYDSPALHKLQSLCCRNTYLDICGKASSEKAHTSILRWIFENDEFSRLPLSPVITFLRLCAIKALEQNINIFQDSSGVLTRIFSGSIKSVVSVSAKTEVTTCDKRFIDLELDIILIDGTRLRVCLENKLFTKEHDKQCQAYVDHYKELDDAIPTLFVFLSPDKNNRTQCPNYIHLLYQEVYDSVLYPLYEYYKEHHSDRAVAYLGDYIDTLTYFEEDFKPIVMSKEYRELLKEIYDNHKDMFFEAIKQYGSEEEKSYVNTVDYNVSYRNGEVKTAVGYTKMARAVIETLLENGISPQEILAKISKVDISGFDNAIVADVNSKGADSRYQKRPIDDAGLFVSNQWCKEKAKAFIDLLKRQFPHLKVSNK